MKTLDNSYCRPSTIEEWVEVSQCIPLGYRSCHQKDAVAFFVRQGKGSVTHFIPLDRSEIPVFHFLDLVHDRIAPWRLEEVGFSSRYQQSEFRKKVDDAMVMVMLTLNRCKVIAGVSGHGIPFEGITNFSELQTLIKFLTPKP